MASPLNKDITQTLNTMLGIYFDNGGIVVIHQLAEQYKLSILPEYLSTGFKILVKDGLVKETKSLLTHMPAGEITRKGIAFYINGGYKPDKSSTSRTFSSYLKKHGWLLVVMLIVLSLLLLQLLAV